jgi:hypothetical protein
MAAGVGRRSDLAGAAADSSRHAITREAAGLYRDVTRFTQGAAVQKTNTKSTSMSPSATRPRTIEVGALRQVRGGNDGNSSIREPGKIDFPNLSTGR